MEKYTYAERVVNKVKKVLSNCSGDVPKCLSRRAVVGLDNNFCLDSIVWSYYDTTIRVTRSGIRIELPNKVIDAIVFYGFDDFLVSDIDAIDFLGK